MKGLTKEELILAYRVGMRARLAEQRIVRLVSQGKVKFAIWGSGEEVHGTATALALSKLVKPEKFGFNGHYRSGALISMWCELHGRSGFALDLFRQQFSKATDPYSGGRQMVYHLSIPELGILPIQSPVGMQLGKAAGYAQGFVKKGVEGALVVAVVGDGSTAEGDLHEAMNAASVWSLPLLILVTDNRIAISTRPEDGRGIKDFGNYAKAFGMSFFDVDGKRFQDVFDATTEAAGTVQREQRAALMLVHGLPRLNGHSSAGNYRFDLEQPDPLLDFGLQLVELGVVKAGDILERTGGRGADFYAHHRLGRIAAEEDRQVVAWMKQALGEPDPDPSTIHAYIRPPFPEVGKEDADSRNLNGTVVTFAGALRAAHKSILERYPALVLGQDIGKLGGVMQATAGLKKLFPHRVLDAPLNEPLIVGTATGAALHRDFRVLCEIQFGDYSLNAYHWFVYLGNLFWSSNGKTRAGVVVRMPTDPFGGGAIYHSMSVEGFFGSIPGLVILMPSTSHDAYGLLCSAVDYGGPVLFLEPKWCYRRAQGPRLPGEPTDETGREELRNQIRHGDVPRVGEGLRVPLGRGAIRRDGNDLTIVAWGRAVWTSLDAARRLTAQGIDAEILDLRTIVPPDLELIQASVSRTGRLLVAHEDRTFHGFGRQIQGWMTESIPGLASRVVGMKEVPGVAQSPVLEKGTVLTVDDIVACAVELVENGPGLHRGWSYIPRRFSRG